MEKVERCLLKEMKPVILYLKDLKELYRCLHEVAPSLQISFEEQEAYSLDSIEQLTQIVEKEELDKIFMDDSIYFLKFFPHKTVVQFNNVSDKSKAEFLDIVNYLEGKQRRYSWLKTKICLYEKPKKRNWLFEKGQPIWLYILLPLILMVIQIILRKIGWMP